MTEVAFHFNMPAKLPYAVRLLRKAALSGAKVTVVGDSSDLKHLDEQLWVTSPTDFIAHGWADDPSPLRGLSAVLLATEVPEQGPHEVLVNMGQGVAPGFERYARVIEMVSQSDADRLTGRERWRYYTQRGYPIVRHDLHLAA
jgi:DNA polymerase-3 subunit chi